MTEASGGLQVAPEYCWARLCFFFMIYFSFVFVCFFFTISHDTAPHFPLTIPLPQIGFACGQRRVKYCRIEQIKSVSKSSKNVCGLFLLIICAFAQILRWSEKVFLLAVFCIGYILISFQCIMHLCLFHSRSRANSYKL